MRNIDFKESLIIKFETNITPIIAHSIEEFNNYVQEFYDKYPEHNKMIITKGNNISKQNLKHMPCCTTIKRNNKIEFFCLDYENYTRVTYAIYQDESDKDKLSDNIAINSINYFNTLAKKLTGKSMFELLPQDDPNEEVEIFTCPENLDSLYYNYVNNHTMNRIIGNCYSLDRNNSFIASMKKLYPQTAIVVDEYYKQRLIMKEKYKNSQDSQEYLDFKTLGSVFIGCLKQKRNKRVNVWKRIVSDSNKIVHDLRKYIASKGAIVTLVNTDAVKFTTFEPIEFEDNYDLGGFKYEWKATDMYIKGVKSYGYVEDNKWKFKQAGKCKLDLAKPDRDTWTLEDFKNGNTTALGVVINKYGKLEEKEVYYG